MVKLASEIVRQALLRTQINESELYSWADIHYYLNNAWGNLYDLMVHSDMGLFIKETRLADGDFLPHDFYRLFDADFLSRSPLVGWHDGYRLINNRIFFSDHRTHDVKYISIPTTLTFPYSNEITVRGLPSYDAINDAYIDDEGYHSIANGFSIRNDEMLPLRASNGGILWMSDGEKLVGFDSEGEELQIEDVPSHTAISDGGTFGLCLTTKKGSITLNDNEEREFERVTSFLDGLAFLDDGKWFFKDDVSGSAVPLVDDDLHDVMISDPYLFCHTEKGNIIGANSTTASFVWNLNERRGKMTFGTVLSLSTDDSTGNGIIFKDNLTSKTVRASFTPDTRLDFPSSVYYGYLEALLAVDLSIARGGDVAKLILARDEYLVSLNRSLGRDSYKPRRMRRI